MLPYNQGSMDHASTSSNVIPFFNLSSRKKKSSIREEQAATSECCGLGASCLRRGRAALPEGIAEQRPEAGSAPALLGATVSLTHRGCCGAAPPSWRTALTTQSLSEQLSSHTSSHRGHGIILGSHGRNGSRRRVARDCWRGTLVQGRWK